ncbi:hypothetical protein [Spiroplasma endosymbiont of Thecophora atra]|uniref:hypothetical protein n=1 Tax=Spiroplasma endosymbiont of Thecophora atra TaxID=3066294 RepID=UPI0030D041E2
MIYDDRNAIILLSIKENLEFKRSNDFIYFEIKNKNIDIKNLKEYILSGDFLKINNYLNYWIKEEENNLFVKKWNKNFRKWPLKNNFIIINLYYIYLSWKDNEINLIKNNLLNLDWNDYLPYSPLMYKLFLIAFAIELKNNPNSDTFFKLLNNKNFLLNVESDYAIFRLGDDFVFLGASFLDTIEFEKIILIDYEYIKLNFPIEKQEEYLKYRIPYFKKIYEHIWKEVIFNYTFKEFDDAINKKNKEDEEKLKLVPSKHYWDDDVNENVGAIVRTWTDYNQIGTKESNFISFSIKQKSEYIKNYLLDEMSNENGSLKSLISVIEIDNNKTELINNFKKIRNSKKQDNILKIKTDYILNYFKYLDKRKELNQHLIYFENINFSKENYEKELEKIKSLILKCFDSNMKKFYFLFIDDPLNSFQTKICNFYIHCLNNRKIDIFDKFYLEIKDKMIISYNQLYKIIKYYSKGTWNREYIFFRLVSLFIDPNVLKKESYFNIKFIANYIENYLFLKKNKWDITKIILLDDYTHVIWIIYMLYNHNNFYSAYKDFEEIFFSKIKIDNIDNYFNDLVIKSLNIESPSIGTGVTYMYQFNTKITCTFNLLIHYILNSQNENNLFELIKSKVDSIVFEKNILVDILYNLFDLYYCINFEEKSKKRIINLLKYIQNEIKVNKITNSSLKSTISFSNEEIKIMKNKNAVDYYLKIGESRMYYKRLYWVIQCHLSQYDDNLIVKSQYINLIASDKSAIGNLITRYRKDLKKF